MSRKYDKLPASYISPCKVGYNQTPHFVVPCCPKGNRPPGAPIIDLIFEELTSLTVYFRQVLNDGDSPITDYEYSIDNGITFISSDSTSPPIIITGLTTLVTYQVIIRAVNAAGPGLNSNMVEGTPNLAPIINNIIPGDTTLAVVFTQPDNGTTPTSYRYSKDNGVSFTPIATTTSPIEITGLTNETTYQVIIQAVFGDIIGNPSIMVTGKPSIYMIVNITIPTDGAAMSLPFTDLGVGGVNINWGDGTTENFTTTPIEHTYATSGNYTIKISGSAGGFGNNVNTYGYLGAEFIISVTQWGALGITSLKGAFINANQLVSVPTYIPLEVTNMENMFFGASIFNQDISGWDVSNVEIMVAMFALAQNFNQNLLSWNAASLVNASYIFCECPMLNQPTSKWPPKLIELGQYYGC